MNSYYQGALVSVTTGPPPGFVDQNNDPTDPSIVTLTVGRRGGPGITKYTYGVGNQIQKVSVSNYSAAIDSTSFVPDAYWYKWQGTGSLQALNEGVFLIMAVDV